MYLAGVKIFHSYLITSIKETSYKLQYIKIFLYFYNKLSIIIFHLFIFQSWLEQIQTNLNCILIIIKLKVNLLN